MKNNKHYAYNAPFKMVDKDGNKYKLIVEQDEDLGSPREWDNVATLVCWHRRYNLGDKHNFDEPQDFWDWVEENGGKENFCIVPLNLYDHSGLTISTSSGYPYNDRWDAGCVGFAYISKETMMKEIGCEYVLDDNGERIKEEHKHEGMQSTYSYKTKPLTDETWRARAKEIIDCEVETYDQYLRGDVYWFKFEREVTVEEKCPHCGEVISTHTECEEEDSCGGFYGDCLEDNGILDEIASDIKFID